jgi:hypothetical protein
MRDNNQFKNIKDVKKIAERLNELLHDDSFHRLELNKEYTPAVDSFNWSENVYNRCQLAEALCRKLSNLNL